MKFKKGFTLIELLVVIAIIGLLAAVVLSSLNVARSKARDAKRLSDMNQLVKAIEMYYSDNGYYPTCNSGVNECISTSGSGYGDFSTLDIAPTYISKVSQDPLNVSGQYGYYYARNYKPTSSSSFVLTNSNQDYIIMTRLENSSKPTFNGFGNNQLNFITGQ